MNKLFKYLLVAVIVMVASAFAPANSTGQKVKKVQSSFVSAQKWDVSVSTMNFIPAQLFTQDPMADCGIGCYIEATQINSTTWVNCKYCLMQDAMGQWYRKQCGCYTVQW